MQTLGSRSKAIALALDARGKPAFFMTILAGALSVLGYAPFFIWPAYMICCAVFMVRLNCIATRADSHKAIRKSAFWAGWAFGFGTFTAGMYWLASAFLSRGGFYVWLSPLGVLLLPSALAFFWAIAARLYVTLLGGPFKAALPLVHAGVFTGVFFIMEFARGHILSGLPWNLPGYIWKAGGSMSQVSFHIGIYGLTALALFCAAALGAVCVGRIGLEGEVVGGDRGRYIPLGLASVLLVSTFTYGSQRLSSASVEYVSGAYLRVVALNVDQEDKHSLGGYSRMIDRYLEASTQPFEHMPTHVIWPEGAISGLVLEDEGFLRAVAHVFGSGTDLLLGATRRVLGEVEADDIYFNSVAALSERNGSMELTALYNKKKLVPFGEYFPGNGIIEGFNIPALTAAVSSFNFGDGKMTALPNLPPVSIQICYESIFSGFTPKPELASDGKIIRPEWILNVSNDSWFGRSTGPHQHFNQARYRAIEEGLPMVRAASSGFSGFIDPYGRILKSQPLGQNGVIDGALPVPIFTRVTHH